MTIKSLQSRKNILSDPAVQARILNGRAGFRPSFAGRLRKAGQWPLRATATEILQVNLGYMCNQTCTHCHVDAGPDRKEIMTRETMELCLDAIRQGGIKTVDLTGGAPEMNPSFRWFAENIAAAGAGIIVRSNLTILTANPKYRRLPAFFARHKIRVISSLPCYTARNTDRQRGDGVFTRSVEALRMLNSEGYGRGDSGLILDLVFNPGGTSLPGPQAALEQDYKRELSANFGIVFNRLFTITNMPISRFLDYLLVTGTYDSYMDTLVAAFNPSAAAGLMCRNTISVGWDGTLYDCDFNQMLRIHVESTAPQHIGRFDGESLAERKIVTGRHCFGCTAGSGSSCQGAIT